MLRKREFAKDRFGGCGWTPAPERIESFLSLTLAIYAA
jgi:hypothetical protein